MRPHAIPLLVTLAAAACGFPDVTYTDGVGPATDDPDTGTPSPDGSAEAAVEGGTETGAGSSADGANETASVTDAYVFEAAPDALVCDQDGDGYLAATSPCNGTDCCDRDSNAHPNETGFFTTADGCGSFDYNCDGVPEPEYPVNITCGGTGLTGCTGGSGFTGQPQCGEMGPYGTCEGSGALKCTVQQITMQTQGCR
jgi:hypothetical protein